MNPSTEVREATLDIPGPQAEEMWASLTAPKLLTWPQGVVAAAERALARRQPLPRAHLA